ncbi:MAG: SDR family NAD(P)-dependent oxidoreductase [Lapillicoccus sp.]
MIDALGRPGRVLLLGGTSEIGLAVLAALPLSHDTEVVLAGRDPTRMRSAAGHLPARLRTLYYDVTQPDTHAAVVEEACQGGDLDIVICAAGVLIPRPELDVDGAEAARLVDTNFSGHVSTLLDVTRHLRVQGHGTIVVLSSIAAVRPRQATLVYGAAKAGLDAFATALDDALRGTGIRVLIVRPGFVVGRMTQGLPAAPFATTPAKVGVAVASGLASGEHVVWVPKGLGLLALVIRLVPRRLWRGIRR